MEVDGTLSLLLGWVDGAFTIPGVPHTSTLPNFANVAGSVVETTSVHQPNQQQQQKQKRG